MRRTDPENSKKNFFRTGNRIFSMNGQWFFAAREGEIGPFPSREVATREVERYIRHRQDLEKLEEARQQRTLSLMPKDGAPELECSDLAALESQR